MPRDDWEETTQVRMIRLEAKNAVAEEREGLIAEVRQVGDDIKEEMRRHFASKADLSDWVLKLHKEGDTRTRTLIQEHVSKDHKVSIIPNGQVSLIPKMRLTDKQKTWWFTIIGGLLGAIGVAIKAYFSQ